jgi:solute:Na+ symporter, SSS family
MRVNYAKRSCVIKSNLLDTTIRVFCWTYSLRAMNTQIPFLDIAIVLLYLIGIALYGSIKGGKQSSAQDYFQGRAMIPWYIVCFSVVAAETSALTFISIPGVGFNGLAQFVMLSVGYLLGRIIVAMYLMPRYYSGSLTTVYSFLETRFGARVRTTASMVFLATRLAGGGVRLFATAIPLKFILHVDYPTAICIIACIAFGYTYFGGIRGAISADAIQMGMYFFAILVTLFVIAQSVQFDVATLTQPIFTRGFTLFDLDFNETFFKRPYTLIAALLGGTFIATASNGTDQMFVQRIMTTKQLEGSRKVLITAGIVVIVEFVLFLAIGFMLFGFYKGATLQQLGLSRSDEVFPLFIVSQIPTGFRGIIIAGIFAAALATLSGSISSMAFSSVMDIIKPFFAKVRGVVIPEDRLLILSKRAIIFWTIAHIGGALVFMQSSSTVVELALGLGSITYGGLLGMFFAGTFSATIKERAMMIGYIGGLVTIIAVVSSSIVAWTWYAGIGATSTVVIALIASKMMNESAVSKS